MLLSEFLFWVKITVTIYISGNDFGFQTTLPPCFTLSNRWLPEVLPKRLDIKIRWTPPWQPKMKVKFRGFQHTGCWMCSTVTSKPPSKLYFGFKIVMIFTRQPPNSLLTACIRISWQPPDSHSKTFVGSYFWEFCVTLVFWFVDSRKCVLGKKYFFSWQLVDSLLTAWQHSDSQGAFTLWV